MRIMLLFCMVCMFGCAGAMPVKPEDATFQKVLDLPQQSKESIFEKSKQWIAISFRSAKTVIEYDNKSEGVIIGNGSIDRPVSDVNPFGGGLVTFTMREDIKDGKARLSFEKLTAAVSPSRYGPGGEYPIIEADLKGTRAALSAISEDLKKYILSNKAAEW